MECLPLLTEELLKLKNKMIRCNYCETDVNYLIPVWILGGIEHGGELNSIKIRAEKSTVCSNCFDEIPNMVLREEAGIKIEEDRLLAVINGIRRRQNLEPYKNVKKIIVEEKKYG